MKKKISLLGVVLGMIAGALVALLAGSWIFWLAAGIAIGVVLVLLESGRRAARTPVPRMQAGQIYDRHSPLLLSGYWLPRYSSRVPLACL